MQHLMKLLRRNQFKAVKPNSKTATMDETHANHADVDPKHGVDAYIFVNFGGRAPPAWSHRDILAMAAKG